jgi:hypothetical protein
MMNYKRNQIEEAISSAITGSSAKPSAETRTRLKRLLDADRALKRLARSNDPEKANYAFYSDDAPGKGGEVLFSEYEAFALMTALRILQHNWPQGFAVSIMRRIRPELERRYTQFINRRRIASKTEHAARAGDLALENADPMFMVIVTDLTASAKDNTDPVVRICSQAEAFALTMKKPGLSSSWLELITPAQALRTQLLKTEPRKRGRS